MFVEYVDDVGFIELVVWCGVVGCAEGVYESLFPG